MGISHTQLNMHWKFSSNTSINQSYKAVANLKQLDNYFEKNYLTTLKKSNYQCNFKRPSPKLSYYLWCRLILYNVSHVLTHDCNTDRKNHHPHTVDYYVGCQERSGSLTMGCGMGEHSAMMTSPQWS